MSTHFVELTSHILPYGTPIILIGILPLIEVFSQVLRPFTLSVRLSTNLAAGHILMYIFCFFSMSLGASIVPIILFLQLFELAISLLQAYIFVRLVSLYVEEGNSITS